MKWLNIIVTLAVAVGVLYYTALWSGLFDTKGCFKVILDDKTYYATAYRETSNSYIFKLPNGQMIEAFKGNVKVDIAGVEGKCCIVTSIIRRAKR